MRRKKPSQVVVKNPSKGLLTYFPPDLSPEAAGQFVVAGQNIRADRGVLKAAPGFERVHTRETNLDGPANLIFQANITATDRESQTTPIIGTEGKVYVMRRRARELICSDCEVSFAVLGDSGNIRPGGDGTIALEEVATLIKSWSPDFVVHVGDLVYGDGGADDDDNPYEAYVARFFSSFLGGYRGPYGNGPASNKFFPTMGNHDWVDGPGYRYTNFFNLPQPETYYTVKRGPVQFFFLNSYGYGPASTGPDGDPINGTGAASGVGEADLSWATSPQAVWLRAQIAESDTAWRVVVFHHPAHTSESHYYPGYTIMDWPWDEIGVDLVLNGHSHVYERIVRDGVTRIICGLGGQTRRSFVNPPTDYTAITDDFGSILTDESGTPLLGAEPPVGPPPYVDYIEGSEARYSSDYGALRVVADRGRLVGRFYNRDGDLIDTFTLTAQRTSSSCYLGDSARAAASLEIVPGTVTTDVGGSQQLLAYLYSADGTRQDVTDRAAWSPGDASIISSDRGLVRGLLPGSTTVTAAFEGLSDTADVEVLVECVDEPLDIVAVLDESYSMLESSGTSTRITRLKEAALLLVDAVSRGPGDRLGIVAFSGDYLKQLAYVRSLAHLDSGTELCRAAVNALTPSGATAVSHGLLAGGGMLESSVAGRRKIVILFTDGFANISNQNLVPLSGDVFADAMQAATVAATRLKDAGITVIVVALDLRYDSAREAVMQGWASDGCYYHADNADELLGIFSALLGDLCRAGYTYQTELPLSVGDGLLTP